MSSPNPEDARTSRQKSSPSSNQTTGDEWVVVGIIVGAFGIKGELKVQPLTDIPDRFEHLTTVYIGEDHQPYPVAGVRQHKQLVLLSLENISDMSAAEALRGQSIEIPLADIAPLPEGQFYLHDVVGLTVRHVDGYILGKVIDVVPGGASELFVIEPASGGQPLLLPVVTEFVKSVNIAAGEVIVSPIPGLFDDQYEEA